MSLAVVYSRASLGASAPLVTVEVHLSNGLPSFSIVGLAETAVTTTTTTMPPSAHQHHDADACHVVWLHFLSAVRLHCAFTHELTVCRRGPIS